MLTFVVLPRCTAKYVLALFDMRLSLISAYIPDSVRKQTRKFAQSIIKPGILLSDMCEQLENMNRKLVAANGLQAGIAFPTGCSLNHVAAHYTPNKGDPTVLGEDDVMKVDFGTQVNGGRLSSSSPSSSSLSPRITSYHQGTNAGKATSSTVRGLLHSTRSLIHSSMLSRRLPTPVSSELALMCVSVMWAKPSKR